MDDYFISIPVSESKNICISPITGCEHESAEVSLGSEFGLFVYETNQLNGNVEVLAKLASREAAERLSELLAAASASKRLNRPIERSLPEFTDDQ